MDGWFGVRRTGMYVSYFTTMLTVLGVEEGVEIGRSCRQSRQTHDAGVSKRPFKLDYSIATNKK